MLLSQAATRGSCSDRCGRACCCSSVRWAGGCVCVWLEAGFGVHSVKVAASIEEVTGAANSRPRCRCDIVATPLHAEGTPEESRITHARHTTKLKLAKNRCANGVFTDNKISQESPGSAQTLGVRGHRYGSCFFFASLSVLKATCLAEASSRPVNLTVTV